MPASSPPPVPPSPIPAPWTLALLLAVAIGGGASLMHWTGLSPSRASGPLLSASVRGTAGPGLDASTFVAESPPSRSRAPEVHSLSPSPCPPVPSVRPGPGARSARAKKSGCARCPRAAVPVRRSSCSSPASSPYWPAPLPVWEVDAGATGATSGAPSVVS